MESSSDGDGDTAASIVKYIFASFLLLPSCNKPQKTISHTFNHYDSNTMLAKAPPPAPVKKKTKKKKLYLTFDDGPNKGTANVLHIIKDEGVPVTFFIVGEHVFASSAQLQTWDSLKMAEHIDICNHSYTHANNRYHSFYAKPDSVVKDFQRTQDSLGLDNPIVRTPGRNVWRVDSLNFTDLKSTTAAADSLKNAGFVVMGWDLEWHYDPKSMSVVTTADKMVQQIDSAFYHNRTKQKDHLVLLAHDQVYVKSSDSFQLRQFLQLLKQKDEYELSVVTTYPGASKTTIPDSLKIKATQ
jgi:peptidoglycan/xylan/chitin deacetylase (PgdA/CDA1 family)